MYLNTGEIILTHTHLPQHLVPCKRQG